MLPSILAIADTVTPQDGSSSGAFRVLDTLVEIGQISSEAAADAKAKLSELYHALVAAVSEEQALTVQAAQLVKDRDASEAAAAAAQRKAAEFEGVSIEILREDVETALAESTLAQERAALMDLEQQELQRQRDQLAEHLDGVAVQHAAALAPVIAGMQEEITVLKRELEQQRVQAAVTQQELDGMTNRLNEAEPVLASLQKEHKQETGRLVIVSAAPDKARRQADLAVADLAAAQQLLATAETKRMEAESALRGVSEQLRQRQMDYASAMGALERARIMLEAKDRHADDVSRDVDLAGLEKERILGDQAGVAMATQVLCREVRMQQEQLARARHDKLLALRAYKAAEDALLEAQEELPPLKIAKELTIKDKAAAQAELAATIVEKEDLKKQVNVRIAQLLKEENFAKDKVALFNVLQQELLLLEQESAALKDEDRQLSRLVADMAAQRDRVARQVAVQQSKFVAASSAAKLRTRQEEELNALVADQERKAAEFDKLFDLIRNQRNCFAALIATARQAAAEMTDRMRLLSSEQEILTAEVATKAQLLDKARSVRTVSVKERDALMNELHNLAGTFRARHDKLHEQIEAIKNLNGLIRKTQGMMVATKKSYEAAVQARNATGVMLIDRNDELAALHEKAHMQEAQIAAGTMELSLREDEMRVLTLQISELERSIHTSRASMPDLPGIDRDIAILKADLLRARQRSAALGEQVVDPSNTTRIRMLGGRVPEKEELVAKLQSLEERLGMQHDTLLEKGVILDEVATLTSQLREEAASARPVGASLAAAANAYQERLRKVTRGMMATISELSLYQATALKLHATKGELEQVLQQAKERLEAGLPPTDEADMEWSALVRQQQTLEDLKAQREQVAAILDQKGHVLVSSAQPRPNAYIPEDLGIPKPYGGFSPFKPSAPGSSMRHIRKPNPSEVII